VVDASREDTADGLVREPIVELVKEGNKAVGVDVNEDDGDVTEELDDEESEVAEK
jgi:hypothetical protein